MGTLEQMHCEACQRGAPTVTDDEMRRFLTEIPRWEVVPGEEAIPQLKRVFEFDDFAAALEFTNRVGAVAEQEGHHPALLTEWGKVTVRWWTHKIRGLHRNDFVMAAKTDELFKSK